MFSAVKPELKSTKVPVKVITDYKSLEYFMAIKKLTRCQACWAKFLLEFLFVIFYISAQENEKADSFTQRHNNLKSDDNDNCQQHLLQTIFPVKK